MAQPAGSEGIDPASVALPSDEQSDDDEPARPVATFSGVSAAMARDAKPHRLELTSDRGASYRLWRQRWDDYAMLARLDNK